MTSSAAISLFDRPRAMSRSTSSSLAVTAAQSWYLGSGRGHNAPATTTDSPAYWIVQLVILALICAVATGIYAIRAHRGGVAVCVAATAMTLPAAFAPRAPLAAAGVLAAATAANELFFGHLVRCGATLPAVFFVAYLAGRGAACGNGLTRSAD
jgi:hypothetical protein